MFVRHDLLMHDLLMHDSLMHDSLMHDLLIMQYSYHKTLHFKQLFTYKRIL